MKAFYHPLSLCLALLAGSWLASNGSPQDEAKPREQTAPPAISLYRGISAPVRASGEADFSDETKTVSYETYYDWDFGTLTFLTETGSISSMPAPKNWQLHTVAVNDGMVAICMLPAAGLSWVLVDGEQWEPIEEESELTVGDYDVRLSAGADGLTALRFDRFSGRSWIYDGTTWVALSGNLTDWPSVEGASDDKSGR